MIIFSEDEYHNLKLLDQALASTNPTVIQCLENLYTVVRLAHGDDDLSGPIDKLLLDNMTLRIKLDIDKMYHSITNTLQQPTMKGI